MKDALALAIDKALSSNLKAAAKTIIKKLDASLRGDLTDRQLQQRISRARKNLGKPA